MPHAGIEMFIFISLHFCKPLRFCAWIRSIVAPSLACHYHQPSACTGNQALLNGSVRADGQVYTVMKMDALVKLIPFASAPEIEQIMLDAIRHRANHRLPPARLLRLHGMRSPCQTACQTACRSWSRQHRRCFMVSGQACCGNSVRPSAESCSPDASAWCLGVTPCCLAYRFFSCGI